MKNLSYFLILLASTAFGSSRPPEVHGKISIKSIKTNNNRTTLSGFVDPRFGYLINSIVLNKSNRGEFNITIKPHEVLQFVSVDHNGLVYSKEIRFSQVHTGDHVIFRE